jgi:hypothetical protein
VTGEDISLRLDLEEKDQPFPNMPDFAIVQQLLAPYAQYGVTPEVQFTMDVPIETERIPAQRQTDLSYIQYLAQRNEFVFYIEPTGTPGTTKAYWGPENRRGEPQPALTMNMGASTNLDSPPAFSFDALKPTTPQVSILEPVTGLTLSIPLPQIGLPAALSGAPAQALRTVLSDDAARLSPLQAGLRALGIAGTGSDAVTASGDLDVLRYGQPLKARRLVGMRGVGNTFGGVYFVQQLTHRIQRGKYSQQFTLAREGLKAASAVVPVLT